MQLTCYTHRKNVVAYKLNKVKINFYEITVVLHGQLNYLINGSPVELNEKDVMFLPPNTQRQRKQSEQPTDYVSIHFLSNENIVLPTKISGGSHSFIPTLLLTLDKLGEEVALDVQDSMTYLLQSLLAFIKVMLLEERENPIVLALKKYMRKNIRKRLSVNDIASHLHFSPSYCNALFKKNVGMPLLAYFTQLRIEEAKNLLLSDEYSLQDVATYLGFEDYNYFSRTFKKIVGVPPGEYRKDFLIQASNET